MRKPPRTTLVFLLAALWAGVPAAAGEGGQTAPDRDRGALVPREVAELEIRNARMPAPKLLTGGQLTREQMEALQDMGYRAFINLRPADEAGTGWEESFAAGRGIDFVRIPVSGGGDLNRANAERLAESLGDGDTGTAVYCASGNRVGALLGLKAYLLDGVEAEKALEFAKAAGVTRLEPVLRERLGLPEATP